MIISSGYNVYPSQIENIIDAHPKVLLSCVVGVKDPYRMQKIKAFVVLKENVASDESTRQEIFEYLKKHVAKYAMPYEIEFRDELPKTLVGKVAYRVLEEEENVKIEAAEKEAKEAEAQKEAEKEAAKAKQQEDSEKVLQAVKDVFTPKEKKSEEPAEEAAEEEKSEE